MSKDIRLSPSSLNLFLKCPRCFWLSKHGVPEAKGIFPSLPGGFDRELKKYYDKFRAKRELPPEIKNSFPVGTRLYEDQEKLDGMRNWSSGLKAKIRDGVILTGALDEIIYLPDGFAPFDYKTKGSAPADDTLKYYQFQLDCYAYMLDENGYKTNGKGYLSVYYPSAVSTTKKPDYAVAQMMCKIIETNTIKQNAVDVCLAAANCLESAIPPASSGCEVCGRIGKLKELNLL